MEKDKSRGLKHIRDKRKYKGKSTKDPKHVPVKLKRNLESNLYRYEKEDDVDGFQLTSNTDFSILASAPITQGHRFQFKSDKIIAEDTENKITNELFSLDLNLLRHSVLTIPFYQRVGIDEKFFMENQINFMKRDAEDNLVKYDANYNTKEIIKDNIEFTDEKSNSDKGVTEGVSIMEGERKKENNCIISEVDDIPEVVEKMEELGKPEMVQKKSNDLEEWLDEILDD
ncbi:hypothetical protein NQ314_013492 [Rhamnusium bicolor]|uniref:Uncharacterized protein n=1 Tax=Rhamnusium bicolor TaxID=1586634 RepID=A0AAV8X653_9CUCU|nr:hypothetical protein NQ314_013492 [Rhamnusium bicolor]